MSLLKRIQQAAAAEEAESSEAAPISELLQLSSAWSVWPALKEITAFKILAENIRLSAAPRYPLGTWAVVGSDGVIYANPLRQASAEEWLFVLAHLIAHLGLRHRPSDRPGWLAACEQTASALALQLKAGTPPAGFVTPNDDWRTDVDAVYADWQHRKMPLPSEWPSSAGLNGLDFIQINPNDPPADTWAMMLTQGLLHNVGGKGGFAPWATIGSSKPKQAIRWFVDHFPLLSALASHFNVIEDKDTIEALQVNIAAVIAERMEIFVNPEAELTTAETRFVMAHEMLHVGLLHHAREGERDHFIWNVACDFVINAWLIEMGVGDMPRGGLYDPSFTGMSSDQIYDKLIKDPQYVRMLRTFRGAGVGDMLPNGSRGGARTISGKVIDDDMAEALMKQGIDAHMSGKRGLLPAGLLEMVTPTPQAAPAWKLSLAKWFDARFEPTAPARTYARQSRRQQSTPEIPRPRYAVPQFPDGSGVFGVMLDTSGSMNNRLLGQCLGAIASLALKYRIKKVRLVFCDVAAHDEGYVPLERLAQPMPVKGRGGTKLQPGIDALEKAEDFPAEAPILIITDGECDVLTVKRQHAFLIPENKRLPFVPVGPVFRLS